MNVLKNKNVDKIKDVKKRKKRFFTSMTWAFHSYLPRVFHPVYDGLVFSYPQCWNCRGLGVDPQFMSTDAHF